MPLRRCAPGHLPGRDALEKVQKVFDAHSGISNEASECTDREFFMLGYGEIGSTCVLAHHHMASDLPNDTPAGLLERFDRLFA